MLLPYPKLRGIAFLVLAVLFGSLIVYDWSQEQDMPDEPERLTINQAAQRARSTDWVWVELQDGQSLHWDCETLTYWESSLFDVTGTGMDIIVTDLTQSAVMVVSFNYRMTCEQLLASQPVLRGRLEQLTAEHCACDDYELRLAHYDPSATFLILYTAYEPPNQGTDTTLIAFTIFSLLASLQGFYAGFIRKSKLKPVTDAPRDSSLPRPLDKL